MTFSQSGNRHLFLCSTTLSINSMPRSLRITNSSRIVLPFFARTVFLLKICLRGPLPQSSCQDACQATLWHRPSIYCVPFLGLTKANHLLTIFLLCTRQRKCKVTRYLFSEQNISKAHIYQVCSPETCIHGCFLLKKLLMEQRQLTVEERIEYSNSACNVRIVANLC